MGPACDSRLMQIFFDQVFKVRLKFEKGKVDLLDHEMDGEDEDYSSLELA